MFWAHVFEIYLRNSFFFIEFRVALNYTSLDEIVNSAYQFLVDVF
jgi:hypothetical protein